jgi:23S rRNA (guanosine2251-2'-O)-methyltransferase
VRNPHSVLAALERRPEQVVSVQVSAGGGDEAWKRVADLARRNKIPLQAGAADRSFGGRSRRDHHPEGKDNGRTSLNEARIEAKEAVTAEILFGGAKERAGGKGIWLALDSLTDPHNVGAIFRIAGFFGIEGILMTSDRSAPLTHTVYDVACGGVETIPHAEAVNLQHAFAIAKSEGLWILGASEHAKESYLTLERDRPWLVVIGNEEKGMRRLTGEACDVTVSIPPLGEVTSLNASVAAGVLISRLMSLA